jgi:RimJ/RimL family protein N-acetyltransferase
MGGMHDPTPSPSPSPPASSAGTGLPDGGADTGAPRADAWGQPIGPALPGWSPRPAPSRAALQGRRCRLEPLDADRHAAPLLAAFAESPDDRDWTYLSIGPFADLAAYRAWIAQATAAADQQHFAILDAADGRALGSIALIRIDRPNGVGEIGFVTFSRRMQRTPAGTEAVALLLRHLFDDLGYRRAEWKCDTLNAPSRAAALRYGFAFEGVFRRAVVYKGRGRDTAWFALTDADWPAARAAFDRWLAPENFDAAGRQRARLEALR